ncbi:MAG: ParB/RepB/Spo0J family partition protein, partial [Clostridia bacterium]|nr:ParB/RepB/Spo0J family partition protein [Clostridia bacterium]
MLSFIAAPRVVMLECAKICPNPLQPRRHFDQAELETLAQSIRQHGLLQPISVRKVAGGYELIAGERRLRAAKLAGLSKIACVLTNVDDAASERLALIENIQRCDLNFFEEAAAMASLISNTGVSQTELAHQLGRSQSSVANKLRLLALEDGLRTQILQAGLTERHARALLILPPQARADALEHIVAAQLNVAQTERYVNACLDALPKPTERRVRGSVRDLRLFDNSLQKAVSSLHCCGITPVIARKNIENGVEYT